MFGSRRGEGWGLGGQRHCFDQYINKRCAQARGELTPSQLAGAMLPRPTPHHTVQSPRLNFPPRFFRFLSFSVSCATIPDDCSPGPLPVVSNARLK